MYINFTVFRGIHETKCVDNGEVTELREQLDKSCKHQFISF